MGNVRFSLLLLVLMLVAVGCDIGATPDKAADTERPVVTMAIEETKQPEKPIETLTERPIEEMPVESPTEQRLATEAIRYAYPPDEMPSVTASFRLPFALDVGEDAVVYVQKVGSTEVFELTSDQTVIALQTLRLTDPASSAGWSWLEEEPTGSLALMVIKSGEDAYETSFYYEENVLSSSTDGPTGTGYLYAYDTQLSLLLHELFEPETAMGKVGALYSTLSVELMTSEGVQTEQSVERDRLTINGKDYLDWEKELSGAEPLTESAFIGFEGELEAMALYEDGVLKLNLAYAFTEPGFTTPDGIEVGTTREEALAKLGNPNLNLPNVWGYLMGDYVRFYLYFVDDKVAAILLTLPL